MSRKKRVRTVGGTRRGIFRSGGSAPAAEPGGTPACLVRQPVFDAEEEHVGHRLVCEDGSGSPGGFLSSIPRRADAELVLAEELHAIAPRHRVLLSLSRKELLERRALTLPADRFVLGIGVRERLDEDLRDAIDRHAMRGLRLAVDGVDLPAVQRPLLDHAHTVVVDVAASRPDQLQELVGVLRGRVSPPELFAAHVEDRSAFQTCRRLGFQLFAGQFFLRPVPGPTRTVAEAGLGGIGTMAELASTDSFEHLSSTITRDPGLSMRLLRYANSAHAALPRRVSSVHEALAWLGTVAVREFALIVALATFPEAPAEMLATALTRARMCQELSRRTGATNPEEAFTVGLFSVAEAVTNAPIEAVVSELPLQDDIASAIAGGDGDLGRLLSAVIAYERGDFASAGTLTGTAKPLAETYLESIRWADSAVHAVG